MNKKMYTQVKIFENGFLREEREREGIKHTFLGERRLEENKEE